jgi:hypothetical protein
MGPGYKEKPEEEMLKNFTEWTVREKLYQLCLDATI